MKVSILGSTGSIGRQALEVIRGLPGYEVVALTAHSNIDLLEEQIKEFRPKLAAIGNEAGAAELNRRLGGRVKIAAGMDGIIEAAVIDDADIILNALIGNVGLLPTHAAITAGKDIALANKETLVTAGELIMPLAAEKDVKILPVDGEHSAIFQCLQGNEGNAIKRLILTASGGPFRGWSKKQIASVTPEAALKHPNWVMGKKITIDCATLMNKGLEVIEARWFFDMELDKIEVVVHPQSIIHSMVEFEDGAILAKMSAPSMTLPIQYALTYPKRQPLAMPKLDFFAQSLTFEPPDLEAFPCLGLARAAMKDGGYMPSVLNAANEIAVARFLDGELSFSGIAEAVRAAMQGFCQKGQGGISIEGILEADAWAREFAKSFK